MRYLILIHSNPRSRAAWERMTDEQQMEFGLAHMRLADELRATGELVVSEGLVPQEHAKRVAVRDGVALTTDGPFAEVKEHLAGFYLVDVVSEERALEIAATAPDAVTNEVEIRPVFDMSMLDTMHEDA